MSRNNETVEEVRQDFLSHVSEVTERDEGWRALCPAHEDHNPSLDVDEGKEGLLLKCWAGCTTESIVKAIGWELRDLFPKGNVRMLFKPVSGGQSITLQSYSEAKGIPVEYLQSLGIKEQRHKGDTRLVIPYHDPAGVETAIRYREALERAEDGPDNRFKWKVGAKLSLYGLEKLEKIRVAGYVVLVEGESDTQTLLYNGIPALGIPGANNWKDEWAEHFEGVEKIYVVVEPDEAGGKLRDTLGKSPVADRLHIVTLDGFKDVSEYFLRTYPTDQEETFKERFTEDLEQAIPYLRWKREQQQEQASGLWEDCKDLAESTNILAEFAVDLRKSGVVGVEKEGKLLYLAATTRYLDHPTSVVVKGPSGAGKTYLMQKTLEFHPAEAAYALTAMSDRALAYSKEPLKHRHLVIYEATAMENSDMLNYLMRSLLSEGHIRYEYVDAGPDGIETKLIDRAGPTGLFVGTTQEMLHPENETRMLSVTVSDTQAQTKAVMKNSARRQKRKGPDMARWHALQRWIKEAGDKQVDIPYGEWLADNIPPLAVRLRRDFDQVLNLIRSHAILHQVNRERNRYGDIVATREDYRVVRGLLADLISEQLEASVPPVVRETVEALTRLYENLEARSDGVSGRALTQELNIDKAATSRRMKSVMRRGFAKNIEEKGGRRAKYAPGDPLPEDIVVLPEAYEIPEECCTVDRVDPVDGVDDDTVFSLPVDNPPEAVDKSTESTDQHPENGQSVSTSTPSTPSTRSTGQHSPEVPGDKSTESTDQRSTESTESTDQRSTQSTDQHPEETNGHREERVWKRL